MHPSEQRSKIRAKESMTGITYKKRPRREFSSSKLNHHIFEPKDA
jgi:hypothetical protein